MNTSHFSTLRNPATTRVRLVDAGRESAEWIGPLADFLAANPDEPAARDLLSPATNQVHMGGGAAPLMRLEIVEISEQHT